MMIGIRQSIIAHYPQLILWLRFPTIPQNHSTSFDMYKSITIYMVKSKLNNAKYIGFVERTTFISSLPLHGLKRWFFFFPPICEGHMKIHILLLNNAMSWPHGITWAMVLQFFNFLFLSWGSFRGNPWVVKSIIKLNLFPIFTAVVTCHVAPMDQSNVDQNFISKENYTSFELLLNDFFFLYNNLYVTYLCEIKL